VTGGVGRFIEVDDSRTDIRLEISRERRAAGRYWGEM